MLDVLTGENGNAVELGPVALAGRLLLAAGLGMVIAWIHRRAQPRAARDAFPFVVTLVLLTVLVAMTALVIGDNVARAFSLVGALAIVRFRTVVEDTRDTAFVIFAVVAGMAVGAGHFEIALIGTAITGAVALSLARFGSRRGTHAPSGDRSLLVRVGCGQNAELLLADLFGRHLLRSDLVGASSARQGAALDVRYAVRFRDPASTIAFVHALTALEGVQHVELETA